MNSKNDQIMIMIREQKTVNGGESHLFIYKISQSL